MERVHQMAGQALAAGFGPPSLHGGAGDRFITSWRLDWPLLLALAVAAFLYVYAFESVRARSRRPLPFSQAASFLAGLAVVAIALLGPLDTWNDDSFAVHMTQHVALMFLAAPLLVLGHPVTLGLRALPPRKTGAITHATLRRGWLRRVVYLMLAPLTVFLVFNGVLLVWHWPPFYNAALRHSIAHEVEHLMFFGASLLFWTPILANLPGAFRITPHAALLLLFASGSVNELLGLTLLFSTNPFYDWYASAAIPWEMTALQDQRLSGVIMLVAGTIVTFGGIFWMLSRSARALSQP